MIKKIESVGTELEVEPVAQRKFPANREVNLSKPETANVISALCSLLTFRRPGECIGIQTLSAPGLRIRNPKGLSCDSVWTWIRPTDVRR